MSQLGDLPAAGSGLDYSDLGANQRKGGSTLTTMQSLGDVASSNLFGMTRSIGGYIQYLNAQDLAKRDQEFNVDPTEDPAGALIDPKEWQAKYSDLGLNFTPDMGQMQAAILVQHRQDELRREYVLDHSPDTLFAKSARTLTDFAVSAVDPLNLAAAFVPGVGETRAGLWAAKFGKTVGRAVEGGLAGATGMAALQPLEYAESQAFQDHYGPMDAFANIAFGTVLGGGLHAGFGKISDFFDRAAPETREAAMRGAVANLAEGRPVDVQPILETDRGLTRETGAANPEPAPVSAPEPAKPAYSPEDLAAAKEDVKTSRAALPNEPHLFDEIRRLGGIATKDANGKPLAGAAEIKRIMDGSPTLFDNKRGLTPDNMREALHEGGWFTGNTDRSLVDVSDLHDLIEQHQKQGKVYHPTSDIHEKLAYRHLLDRETSDAGITPQDSTAVAAHKLAEYRAARSEEELAAYHDQAAQDHTSHLPDSELEALYSHGYEPGSDIGAEFDTGEGAGAIGGDQVGNGGSPNLGQGGSGVGASLGQAERGQPVSPEARQAVDRARKGSIDFAKGQEPSTVAASPETQAHAAAILKAGDDPKAELAEVEAQLQGYKAQGVITEAESAALDAANAADSEVAKARTDGAEAAARCLFLHP